MKHLVLFASIFLLFDPLHAGPDTANKDAQAPKLQLISPLDYQVIQRPTKKEGSIPVSFSFDDAVVQTVRFEARLTVQGTAGEWQLLNPEHHNSRFVTVVAAPAGGWHRLEVRASRNNKVIAEAATDHVGIGEVFVVAGQSNSANHGAEKQTTQTGRVAAFDGQCWQLANDPQPGASGKGGSFMPPFGDEIVQRFDVPVGFIACGIGATSVREWLPKGTTFPNPPTIENRVQKRPDGTWESKGDAFNMLVTRMDQAGLFRAVLWHQGESDANQKDPTRTLAGNLYREHLEKIIRDSHSEISWAAPWFVAQVSYHGPGDESSPDIRSAQASLWKDGIALEGPDSDALKGDLRERNGQGVHFSGKGLREHAAKWAEKVAPWLEKQLASPLER